MWKRCCLGDLVTFHRGYDLPHSQMIAGIYPVIGSNGIIGWHNQFTTESPSITIGRSGNVGNPFIFYGRSWSHNTTLYVQKFNDCDPVFIYYLLKTLKLENFAGGSAVPTLNRNHIHSLEVEVPKEKEKQKYIGLILKVLDDKIKLNQKINDNLQQQAQSLYKEMFINDPNVNMAQGVLGDIASITMGQSPIGSSYNEENIGTVFYQGRAEFGSRFPNRRLFTTEPKRMANRGDILLSVRAPVGDINVANEPCCIGRGLAAIHSKSGHNSFLLYSMFVLQSYLDIYNGEGTVFGSINQKKLSALPIYIPSTDKIIRFENMVTPIDSMIQIRSKEIQYLCELRDQLLPRLMNGDIDIASFSV